MNKFVVFLVIVGALFIAAEASAKDAAMAVVNDCYDGSGCDGIMACIDSKMSGGMKFFVKKIVRKLCG